MPEKIKRHIREHYLLPFLRVDGVESDQVQVTFQLPLPLAKFWWKGGEMLWGENSIAIENSSVEWGWYYRQLMPVVWQSLDDCHELEFSRLNEVGEHDPDEYYYIWVIKRADW